MKPTAQEEAHEEEGPVRLRVHTQPSVRSTNARTSPHPPAPPSLRVPVVEVVAVERQSTSKDCTL